MTEAQVRRVLGTLANHAVDIQPGNGWTDKVIFQKDGRLTRMALHPRGQVYRWMDVVIDPGESLPPVVVARGLDSMAVPFEHAAWWRAELIRTAIAKALVNRLLPALNTVLGEEPTHD